MTAAAEKKRVRFVHLGDRLLAIERIRAGQLDAATAAQELGVSLREVLHWLHAHAGERTVTLEELRGETPPELARLARRVQKLATLVADAERLLRELHEEFASKQFGGKTPFRALRVVRSQPSGV